MSDRPRAGRALPPIRLGDHPRRSPRFPQLSEEDRRDLKDFFALATILPIYDDVIDRDIALRQQRKMGLGDALIAATALVHGLTLVTWNVKDFRWIDGLDLLDPPAIGPAEDEGGAAET